MNLNYISVVRLLKCCIIVLWRYEILPEISGVWRPKAALENTSYGASKFGERKIKLKTIYSRGGGVELCGLLTVSVTSLGPILKGAQIKLNEVYTRWFKYDRDCLHLFTYKLVPVIFEPPCIIKFADSKYFISHLFIKTYVYISASLTLLNKSYFAK